MAKGMDSDVSDDDSDSPSYNEFLDLVHEHQRVIKKESQKCNALNDLNATLATNYDDLLRKFQLLGKEHEELKLKTESITKINDSLETSNSCNRKCHEDAFVFQSMQVIRESFHFLLELTIFLGNEIIT